ncbi:MAG: hypothetical protein FWF37_04840, partial [Chloroflexi bacterium]|nr:hypothetical protein [Chloroflexota bacterium]
MIYLKSRKELKVNTSSKRLFKRFVVIALVIALLTSTFIPIAGCTKKDNTPNIPNIPITLPPDDLVTNNPIIKLADNVLSGPITSPPDGTPLNIAGGAYHNLELLQDGTVWAWGYNASGQLGTEINTRAQVFDLTSIIAISAGASHSLALRNDGTVWAWGSNTSLI